MIHYLVNFFFIIKYSTRNSIIGVIDPFIVFGNVILSRRFCYWQKSKRGFDADHLWRSYLLNDASRDNFVITMYARSSRDGYMYFRNCCYIQMVNGTKNSIKLEFMILKNFTYFRTSYFLIYCKM